MSWCTSVHAAARKAEQGQRGGEVSGDQGGRPAEWEPAVVDQEHDRGEAASSVLQQGDETAGTFIYLFYSNFFFFFFLPELTDRKYLGNLSKE